MTVLASSPTSAVTSADDPIALRASALPIGTAIRDARGRTAVVRVVRYDRTFHKVLLVLAYGSRVTTVRVGADVLVSLA